MGFNLRNKSLMDQKDFALRDMRFLLDLAAELKRSKYSGHEYPRLKGKNIALIFEKASTRSRCSFELVMYDQGGLVIYLDSAASHLGYKESLKETARVLGRLYNRIKYRGIKQSFVEDLATFSHVSVWDGLTDKAHPTQVLADPLTMNQIKEKPVRELSFRYLGDARLNMGSPY